MQGITLRAKDRLWKLHMPTMELTILERMDSFLPNKQPTNQTGRETILPYQIFTLTNLISILPMASLTISIRWVGSSYLKMKKLLMWRVIFNLYITTQKIISQLTSLYI